MLVKHNCYEERIVMKEFLIIPDRNHIRECIELSKKYNLGFEYNDFFFPDLLDDEGKLNEIISDYKKQELPEYTTTHGDFFDVIPFSMDVKIREVSDLRINQSIDVARRIGAKAVILHTNYNPFLNTKAYVDGWIKQNAEYWSEVLEKNPDMNIYLENMFDSSPDIMEALSEKLQGYSNYGLCLDYAHAAISNVEPQIWAKQLGRFVKHVHINDNDRISDLHLAWGDGVIDREVFYESYDKYMNGATVLIETNPMDNKIRTIELMEKEGFLIR